jgi:hypothetical protein
LGVAGATPGTAENPSVNRVPDKKENKVQAIFIEIALRSLVFVFLFILSFRYLQFSPQSLFCIYFMF